MRLLPTRSHRLWQPTENSPGVLRSSVARPRRAVPSQRMSHNFSMLDNKKTAFEMHPACSTLQSLKIVTIENSAPSHPTSLLKYQLSGATSIRLSQGGGGRRALQLAAVAAQGRLPTPRKTPPERRYDAELQTPTPTTTATYYDTIILLYAFPPPSSPANFDFNLFSVAGLLLYTCTNNSHRKNVIKVASGSSSWEINVLNTTVEGCILSSNTIDRHCR